MELPSSLNMNPTDPEFKKWLNTQIDNAKDDIYKRCAKLDKNGNVIKCGQWVSPRQTHADYSYPTRVFYVSEDLNGFITLLNGEVKINLSNYRNSDTQYHSVEIVVDSPIPRPSWTEHNLNDEIEFELTEKGVEFVRTLNLQNPIYSRYNLTYTEKDTPYKSSLWEFCSIFGSTFGMGFDQTVKTSFKLRSR